MEPEDLEIGEFYVAWIVLHRILELQSRESVSRELVHLTYKLHIAPGPRMQLW